MSSEDGARRETRGTDGPMNIIKRADLFVRQIKTFQRYDLETYVAEKPLRLWPDYHEWIKEKMTANGLLNKWENTHVDRLETGRKELIEEYNKEEHFKVNKDAQIGMMDGKRDPMEKVFEAMNLLPLQPDSEFKIKRLKKIKEYVNQERSSENETIEQQANN